MALVLSDRVKELSTTTGTGSFTLAGAPQGFQTFNAGVGVGNTCYYAIADVANNAWEVGVGTLSGATTLARTTVLASSNANNLVNFVAGNKEVYVTYPANKSVFKAADGTTPLSSVNITSGTAVLDNATLTSATINSGSATLDNTTLASVTAQALHRSPYAVTAMFIYDTSKDSDGGAWTEKCQHTSWYNEPLNGKWLGAQASEAAARAVSGATTGDYFQLTTDGKFYKLNATSGTTEVFRGNKAKFPKLAGIVAEAANVTIYDLTEPGRPMWMRFVAGTNTYIPNPTSSVFALNGRIGFAGSAISNAHLYGGYRETNFPSDSAKKYRNFANNLYSGVFSKNVAGRNLESVFDASAPAIASETINAVAMTVLPDAPVDPVTGLQVPTIAVATAGGVSVIKHNGTVVNLPAAPGPIALGSSKITLDNWSILTGRIAGASPNFWQSKRDTYALLPTGGNNSWGYYDLKSESVVAGSGGYWGSYPASGLEFRKFDRSKTLSSQSNGISTVITNTYNTGHMVGDIRRCYLSDNVAGSVTGPELVTNGTFDTDTTGWANVTWNSGVGRVTNTGTWVYGNQNVTTVAGKTYCITADVVFTNAGLVYAVGGVYTLTYPYYGVSTGGKIRCYFVATSASTNVNFSSAGKTNGTYFEIDNVSVKECVADRSYKNNNATAYGTLTTSTVAPNAQLVAYSGFSAENYLQEPYSADLDFGTGEWSAGAWVNTTALSSGINLIPNSGATSGPSLGGPRTITRQAFTDPVSGIIADRCVANSGGTGFGADVYVPLAPGVPYTFSIWLGLPSDSTLSSLTVGIYGYGPSYTNINVPKGSLSRVSITITIPNTSAGIATWLAAVNYYGGLFSVWGINSGSATVNTAYFAQAQLEVGSSPSGYMPTTTPIRMIADRAFSSGAYLQLYHTHDYKIASVAYDGTTTRIVTTTAAYNTGTWLKAEAVYKTDGSLAILVNGQEVAVTRGNPLLTLNNSNAVLTIGNSYDLDAPFPGSIALLKLSATAPTYDQAAWMYEQEKQLFRDGAQCCLPDSGNIVDLTYDDVTDKWMAVSATNESSWTGLVRTNVTAVPAGSNSKVVATSGVKLNARTTTSPGVDVTIPAYGLREELLKDGEDSGKLSRIQVPLDYVGGFTATTVTGNTAITSVAGLSYPSQTTIIGARVSGTGIPANTTIVGVSGTTIYLSAAATAAGTAVQISFTDFVLPLGMEAKEVYLAGVSQKEGSTSAFTRLYDGFRETISFGVAPSYTAFIQIQAIRSQA